MRGLSWLERKTVSQLWVSSSSAWLGVDGFEGGKVAGLKLEADAVGADGVEVEDHVELVAVVADDERSLFEGDAEGFAYGHDVILRHDVAIHLLEVLVHVGAVGVGVAVVVELVGREVGEGGVLRDEGDDVHAEAVDAFVEPEAHEAVDLFADLGIVPVEVGLFYGEVVEVVLAGGGVELPG